jgi:tRNA G46 methylase TrmB
VADAAGDSWERFYQSKHDTFFQKRNYLHHVFPELLANASAEIIENARQSDSYEPKPRTASQCLPTFAESAVPRTSESMHDDDGEGSMILMEVGCGTGSSLFSLASLRPDCRLVGCDLSPHAVELVKVRADRH